MLLDEPTAGLTHAERQGLCGYLTTLASRARLCILLVEHDLDFGSRDLVAIIVLHQARSPGWISRRSVNSALGYERFITGQQYTAPEVGPMTDATAGRGLASGYGTSR